jgi:hypothetical protein
MEKLTLFTVLVCMALVACEPRGTPQKPKTIAQPDETPVVMHLASGPGILE